MKNFMIIDVSKNFYDNCQFIFMITTFETFHSVFKTLRPQLFSQKRDDIEVVDLITDLVSVQEGPLTTYLLV